MKTDSLTYLFLTTPSLLNSTEFATGSVSDFPAVQAGVPSSSICGHPSQGGKNMLSVPDPPELCPTSKVSVKVV